jgi:hypothetical protein
MITPPPNTALEPAATNASRDIPGMLPPRLSAKR